MTKNNEQNKQAYICPAMKAVNILPQTMLAGSNQIETIGETKEEIGWGSNERRGEWDNLW